VEESLTHAKDGAVYPSNQQEVAGEARNPKHQSP